jgi:hypothetical protein
METELSNVFSAHPVSSTIISTLAGATVVLVLALIRLALSKHHYDAYPTGQLDTREVVAKGLTHKDTYKPSPQVKETFEGELTYHTDGSRTASWRHQIEGDAQTIQQRGWQPSQTMPAMATQIFPASPEAIAPLPPRRELTPDRYPHEVLDQRLGLEEAPEPRPRSPLRPISTALQYSPNPPW